ncbi:MAG: hypothetical protein AAF547_18290 [Actinomycetota bacterium]
MSQTIEDMEARLTATLRAVADQTEPIAPATPLRLRTAPPQPTEPDRSAWTGRGSWLAAAAVIAAVLVGGLILADTPDQQTEAAGEPTAEPPIDLGDGPLYLLPPAGTWTGPPDFSAGDEVTTSGDGHAVVAYRASGDASAIDQDRQDLVSIQLTTQDGTFDVNLDDFEIVAGRTIYDSRDEGVVEILDDRRYILYQTELDNPELAAIVAATSVDGDRLIFAGTEGGLTTFGEVPDLDDMVPALITVAVAEPAGDEFPEAPLFTLVTLTTEPGTEEAAALFMAGEFQVPRVEPVAVGGRTGWAFDSRLGEAETLGWSPTILVWSPTPGTAALMIGGQPQDQTIELAEQLRIVDEETWRAELTEAAGG